MNLWPVEHFFPHFLTGHTAKTSKKVFNWSEGHLYWSNLLQNPYFKASPDSCQDPESLMRIFLNVECLQPAFSSFLLEKLAILSLEFEDQRTVCY